MAAKGNASKTPQPTSSSVSLDNRQLSLTAFNIDGNNYFRLRDIGKEINFGVDWDAATNSIAINTSKIYIED